MLKKTTAPTGIRVNAKKKMTFAEAFSKIAWTTSLPMIVFHVVAAVAIFFVPVSAGAILLCIASYYLRMFVITAGYHRYFSHRSYKTSRIFQFMLAFLGGAAVQKGALWWAANHRFHHKHSDEPIDLHSPCQHGFWWSHMGWILSRQHDETLWEQIPDLAKFPELRFLNRFHVIPPLVYGTAIFLAFGWPGFIWGFLVSTVALWHGTFTINSLSHVFGTQRYKTTDTSRNNFWLSILTMGEGWHNNHHAYELSTRQGFFWWEIDPSFMILKSMSWVGITRGLKEPPLAQLRKLEIKRLRATEPATAPLETARQA